MCHAQPLRARHASWSGAGPAGAGAWRGPRPADRGRFRCSPAAQAASFAGLVVRNISCGTLRDLWAPLLVLLLSAGAAAGGAWRLAWQGQRCAPGLAVPPARAAAGRSPHKTLIFQNVVNTEWIMKHTQLSSIVRRPC